MPRHSPCCACKDLYRDPLVVQVDIRLVPIHLRLVTPGVLLWHECLGHDAQPQRPLALPHVLTHRRLGDLIADRALVIRTQVRCAGQR